MHTMTLAENPLPLHEIQRLLHDDPSAGIAETYTAIYEQNRISIGWPDGARRIFEHLARDNTVAVIGAQLGDEGKGRIVDNKLEAFFEIPGVSRVYIIRFQGGSNAGHSIERDGVKLALHHVPSGVLYPEAVGIMDRGMAIHPEDLQTEIEYVEDHVGDTRDKLLLSQDAILATDLERAEEILNRTLHGEASGGTGRGIEPAYAHHYDRLGLKIRDLIADNWRETLAERYDQYETLLRAFDIELADTDVPDFRETKKDGQAHIRKVGSKEEFLDRLASARTFLVDRAMTVNTFMYHRNCNADLSTGVLFEGAQALGLHAWLGTYPDVTASDTSVYGIQTGTGYWKAENIQERIGVFKIPYTSSVGARIMPTHVPLPGDLADLPDDARPEQQWAAFVREQAHEYGTTTGRPRDILHLDLPMLLYNARMAGIEVLAGTHLDIAREGEQINVCTHYTDEQGNYVPYQPGLHYQEDVISQYIELPGWNGKAAQNARSFDELAENAQKFLAFIQARTGYPIVAATTCPARENMVEFAGYRR